MSNDLLVPESFELTTASSDDVSALTRTGDYLPRVQVMGSNTDLVKSGKFPMGHFGLIWTNDNLRDLGTSFDFLAVTFRARATRIADGANPISYFDRKDPEFVKIVDESSAGGQNGCMYGIEFLLWIPNQREWALFHFNNKTLRRCSPELLSLMDRGDDGTGKHTYGPAAATAQIEFIKNKKYSWHGASIIPCTAGLPAPEDKEEWELDLMEQVKKFRNPPRNLVEKVESGRDR